MAKMQTVCLVMVMFLAIWVSHLEMITARQVSEGDQYALEKTMKDGPGSAHIGQCKSKCNVRCSKTHHKGNCMDDCQICCKQCLCVPRGTYGNKGDCACYNNKKNNQGGPKCP